MATKGIQTANGKAFEYACILAVYEELHGYQNIVIEDSLQMDTARYLYETAEESLQEALDIFEIRCKFDFCSFICPCTDRTLGYTRR